MKTNKWYTCSSTDWVDRLQVGRVGTQRDSDLVISLQLCTQMIPWHHTVENCCRIHKHISTQALEQTTTGRFNHICSHLTSDWAAAENSLCRDMDA